MNWTGLDHGIPLFNAPFWEWFVAVPVAYIVLVVFFRVLGLMPEETRDKSRTSDMMAFLIVSGSCCAYLGVLGTIGWFNIPVDNLISDTSSLTGDNFYGRSQFVVDHLVAPMLAYQGWNIVLCFFVKDLMDIKMIGHHLATFSLGYFGLYPYLHYYGLFFFGFAEVTNIPLTLVDAFRYSPVLKEKFSWLNDLSRGIFGAAFIVIRLVMWPYYSYLFWVGSVDLLQSGKAHSNFVVSFFLLANIFLTGLQFLWGSTIISFIIPKGKKDTSKENTGKKDN